jgi:predicted methyltransferase
MKKRALALAGSASLLVATWFVSAWAQSGAPQSGDLQAGMSSTQSTSTNSQTQNPDAVPILDWQAKAFLRRAVSGEQRIDAQRDRWRNPDATLQFFAVRPSDTVVEIWPGQGWYTSILGPYLKLGDGKLIVGHFDAASSNSQVVRQIVEAYRNRFAANPSIYGNVSVVPFGPRSAPFAPANSVDRVLTFRNIHNWMAQGWAEKAFAEFFFVLKPGGILGIEEHRGRTDEPQDPLARDGYVREDYVIQLAREAGFEFAGRAEINANPADTKDHPFGVWTLPPVSRTSMMGEPDDPSFDRRRFDAIGESDRMTLRFRKPLSATGVADPSLKLAAAQVPVTIVPAPPPALGSSRRGRRGVIVPTPTPAPETGPKPIQATPISPAIERIAAQDKADLASKPQGAKSETVQAAQTELPKAGDNRGKNEEATKAIPAIAANTSSNRAGAVVESEANSTNLPPSRTRISEQALPEIKTAKSSKARPEPAPELTKAKDKSSEIEKLAQEPLAKDQPTKSDASTAKGRLKRGEPEAKPMSARARRLEAARAAKEAKEAKAAEAKKPKGRASSRKQAAEKKVSSRAAAAKRASEKAKRGKKGRDQVAVEKKSSLKAAPSKKKNEAKRSSSKKPDWKTPPKANPAKAKKKKNDR